MNSPSRSYQALCCIAAVALLCTALASPLFSQVTIRERVAIRPSAHGAVLASTGGDPVSTSFIVAPSDGMMQIWSLYATQAESTVPFNARLIVSTPLGQRIDTIWSNCSNRYQGIFYSGLGAYYNSCTNAPVVANTLQTREGFDRTMFFPVQEGDTLRFSYWSNGWADSCTGFSSDGPDWDLHFFKSGRCYVCDSIGLTVYLSYADSGFAQLTVNPLLDTLVYGDTVKNATSIAIIAKSTLGREVQAPDTMKISLALTGMTTGDEHDAVVVGPQGDTVSSTLSNIAYSDARAGKVKIAGITRPTAAVAAFLLEASAPGQSGQSGADTIYLRRRLNWKRFPQDDPAWANDHYGSKPDSKGIWHTIQQKGCFVSTIATCMFALGVDDVDPGKLNAYLQQYTDGFSGEDGLDANIWRAIKYGSQTKVSVNLLGMPPVGDLQVSAIDQYLESDNYCVMVKVKHLNESDVLQQHWVAVAAKVDTIYSIVDNGFSTTTTLGDYQNTVYKAYIFKTR